MGFSLGISFGVTGEWDFSEGTIALGGHANIGPGTLFVGMTKISVSLNDPFTMQSYEMGFKRDTPEAHWVVVKTSTVSRIGFVEFGERYVPYRNSHPNVHYQIVEVNPSKANLKYKYGGHRLLVFD